MISGHQEFFFLAIWWAGYFFFPFFPISSLLHLCSMQFFSSDKRLQEFFFQNHPPPPPQELNGRPLNDLLWMSEGFSARFPLSVKSVRFPVFSWLRRSCVGLHLTPKYLRCNRTQGIKDRNFLDNLALVNKSRAVLTCQSDGPFPFLFGVLSTKKERLITSYRGFFFNREFKIEHYG